jgi:hypothetical protein
MLYVNTFTGVNPIAVNKYYHYVILMTESIIK